MSKKTVFIIGQKESFIIRVLVKKLEENGIEADFVKSAIDTINESLVGHENAQLVLYLDPDERIPHDLTNFLNDRLTDEGRQFILVGDAADTRKVIDNVAGDLIYKTFNRPLNNDEFVKTVLELFGKIEAGEYRKSILIVDDDPTYMGLVRDWLKDEYRVAMANSGLQAIKWLGKNKVDLILLDHEMPVTSGPQVLEMLRSDSDTRSIPVIFLTGKGDKESVMQVVAFKPEGYLLKTIERKELLLNLRNFFKTGKVQV